MALQKSGLDLIAQNAGQYLSDMGKAHSANQTFAEGATKTASTVNAAGETIGRAAQNATGLYQDAAGKWRTASGQFATSAEQAAAGVTSATGKLPAESGGHFQALAEIATGALRRVGEVAVNALGAAAQAAGQFVADSVTAAGDFEAAVNNLAAISGTALAEAGYSFDDVSAKALQLGQDTRYSASESIAAMTELVKGGVPVAEVMNQATDATLNLAAAAGLDLANAAEIVAKQYGVWADTGVDATQITDLLAQAANASTVGVEDLALGLANAGGTAKTAGLSFGDLTQTMALIAPNFSSAADAGTSLKTFISRLIPTTDSATTAMVDLGLATADGQSKFFDATGAFIGMQEASELLANATDQLSEEQKLLAFNTIFGSDAIRAAAAIAEAGGEGFDAMGEAMAAAGTAAETAAIQNQGFNFAMDSLKGSIETLQITLGSYLLPILTTLINDHLIPGVAAAQTFTQAIFGNSEAFSQLSPPLQQAATLISDVVAAAEPLVGFLADNLQPILIGVAGVLGGVLVGALAAAAAPFAPLIGAIGLTVAAGAALYEAWNSNFGGIQQTVTTALNTVWGAIQSVIATIVAFWDANGAEITASAQRWWGQTVEIVGGVVNVIAGVVTQVFGAIGSFLDEHGAQVQTVLSFAWDAISNTINLALGVIQGVVTTALGVISGDWDTALTGIQGVVDSFVTYIGDSFTTILDLIEGLSGQAMDAGRAFVENIKEGILGAIDSLIQTAKDKLAELADLLPGSEPKDPSSPLRGLGDRGKAFVGNFGQGVTEAAPQLKATIADVFEQATLPTIAGIGRMLEDAGVASVAAPATPVAAPSLSYVGDTIAVDARGSTMGEARFRSIVEQTLEERGQRADIFRRMRSL